MRMKKFIKGTALATAFSISVCAMNVSLSANEPDSKLNTAVIMYVGSSLAYVDGVETFIDKDEPLTSPLIENDRTYVPLRFVSEAFKAEVNWNAGTKTVTIKRGGKTIKFVEGSKEITIDGKNSQMDTPAKNIGGSIYIPLRFMAEAIGKEAFYDRGLIIISDKKDIYDPVKDKAELDGLIAKVNNLPVVGTKENFISLVGQPPVMYGRGAGSYDMDVAYEYDGAAGESAGMSASNSSAPAEGGMSAPAPAPTLQASASAATSESYTTQKAYDSATASTGQDFSTTNVQVEGVDEGDIIKTDGQFIYYSKGNRVIVVKASPAAEMKVEYDVTFDDESFHPVEIYVDGNNMAVIGNTMLKPKDSKYYYNFRSLTRTYVFDLTDKANVKKIREIDEEGHYISSRKIGKTMYVLSESSTYNLVGESGYILPAYRDTNASEDYVDIGYDRIRYFPNFQNRSITTIMGFQINDTSKKAIVNTFMGSSGNIYVSTDNLYVVQENYNFMPMARAVAENGIAVNSASVQIMPIAPAPAGNRGESTSIVYKFSLNAGNATFLCKSEVAGTALNQFSMDESNGFFRIATTSYDYNNGRQTNNMFVMDENLKLAGSIRNIAPEERIYSARFMGERAYMVTFKNVDPLFVIDLKDPYNPKILGALKIPGYSNYLHPYDATHLIGFGKDTTEQYGNAYYKGMKISMFDVSDVANPKELFTEMIGDRGTESDLLHNHRALLFSKERNIMAFPVNVYEIKNKKTAAADNSIDYGEFTYQGAYVYGIDMNEGFKLKGKISHLTDEDYLKSGMYGGDYEKYIRRIIYIGDYFYTASDTIIKATAMDGMKDVSSVKLPKEEYNYDRVYKE